MIQLRFAIIAVFASLLALSSCKTDSAAPADAATEAGGTAAAEEAAPSVGDALLEAPANEQISTYVATKGLSEPTTLPSGVSYIITKPGEGGERPTLQSQVTINYKGYLVNDKIFDQSKAGAPATFGLNQLIQAWQETIPLIGKGGAIKIFAPPAAAYGSNPPPGTGITANTVLVFDVELLDF